MSAIARIVGERVPVVPGGATRTASSWAGLDALRGSDVIAIHDAARPFASPSLFAKVVAVATEYGSAVPGLAIAETVRRADPDGRAVEEVDRNGLWTAQTPQAFGRALLERARAAAGTRIFTDDAAAVIAMNEDVRLVPGERRNFKLTSSEDVAYARELADKGLVAIAAQPLPR
jgi:2-C-methyl-D-erythritol 4-phosphate cytidylyltransferase